MEKLLIETSTDENRAYERLKTNPNNNKQVWVCYIQIVWQVHGSSLLPSKNDLLGYTDRCYNIWSSEIPLVSVSLWNKRSSFDCRLLYNEFDSLLYRINCEPPCLLTVVRKMSVSINKARDSYSLLNHIDHFLKIRPAKNLLLWKKIYRVHQTLICFSKSDSKLQLW